MITPDQRVAILDSIRSGLGISLARACHAAGVKVAEAEADPEIAEAWRAAAIEREATTVVETPIVAPEPKGFAAQFKATYAALMGAAPVADEPNEPDAPRIEMGDNASEQRWRRPLADAARLGPGLYGALLYVDSRRAALPGAHGMDEEWLTHFKGFYASGEFEDIGRFGVRAAKSDSVSVAISSETTMNQRQLDSSIVGVCPVMSANMREAGDRFDTIKAIMRALGLRDISGSKADVDANSFKASGGGNSALVIALLDSQGHSVEIRVYPASEAGAAGFTGIAGFGDELDLWGKSPGANPAAKVLRVLRSRYTTQPEAKLHLMSASYERDSEHARLIALGNIPGQYVARIGVSGAAKDHAARLRLAKAITSADPLLLAPPLDPMCGDIPSWVTNPIAPIESAWKKSKGDLREMFALYGGRLELAGGAGAITLEEMQAIVDMNRDLAQPTGAPPSGMRSDGLLHVPGFDNDRGAGPGRYRGL